MNHRSPPTVKLGSAALRGKRAFTSSRIFSRRSSATPSSIYFLFQTSNMACEMPIWRHTRAMGVPD